MVFLGMNPGPFGMVQTGVPFGEIAAVRDWLRISAPIAPPPPSIPSVRCKGYDCPRSEVSGRRLWKLFAERFGTPEKFFAGHFVANYCPLAFLSATGSNVTPDKLAKAERLRLGEICDAHLRRVLEILAAGMAHRHWRLRPGAGRIARRPARPFAWAKSCIRVRPAPKPTEGIGRRPRRGNWRRRGCGPNSDGTSQIMPSNGQVLVSVTNGLRR